MHYYKFNIKDWSRDTAHLSIEEEGVYRRLIDHYYESEAPIPTETKSVIRRLRLGGHEEALRIVLGEFFEETPEGYRHGRCDDEIAKYQAKADANRANGKRGGRPSKPTENPDGYENEPTDNLNHKPLTINQEPKEKSIGHQQAADLFDRFWKLYPNKKGKANAEKAWVKLKVGDDLFNMIAKGLAAQVASQDWKKDGGAFIPHPATWLNGRRWEDEVSERKAVSDWQSRHIGLNDIDHTAGLVEREDGSYDF